MLTIVNEFGKLINVGQGINWKPYKIRKKVKKFVDNVYYFWYSSKRWARNFKTICSLKKIRKKVKKVIDNNISIMIY